MIKDKIKEIISSTVLHTNSKTVDKAVDKIVKLIEKDYKPVVPGYDRKYTFKEFKEQCEQWDIRYKDMLIGWKAYKEGKDVQYHKSIYKEVAGILAKKTANKCCEYIPELSINVTC